MILGIDLCAGVPFMRKNWESFLAGGVLLVATLLDAQSIPTNSPASLLVNVIDSKGDAIRDLTKANFRIKVNGRSAEPVDASYSLAPRRIAVVLDMSGSMAGGAEDKRWLVVREAVEDVLADTSADVPIAFLTFSDHVHDVFDFSQSRNSIAAWLKQGVTKGRDSRVRGRTALFDALDTATKMFGPSRPGDAIYVITDGGDNDSHIRARTVREMLLRTQTRLFVFLLSEKSRFDMNAGSDSVKEIARTTGGFVFGVSGHNTPVDFLSSWNYAFDYNERTRERIKLYTRALSTQVNGFYILRFDAPASSKKTNTVSLDIVDDSGKSMSGVGYTYSAPTWARPK